MNLRDLWDNVVLRDILGYIVPGLVTLFAVALLVNGITGTTLPETVTQAAESAGLDFLDGEHWLAWHPWLAVSLVVPLAYGLGHLQMWVVDALEAPGRPWYTGSFAIERLKNSSPGLAYYSAATKIFPAARSEHLRPTLVSGQGDVASHAAADAARHLFLLCDRYVLYKDRDLHSMFMGRFYVLAVLFTNLGLSFIVLGLCALVPHFIDYPVAALFGLGALCLLAAGLLKRPSSRGDEKTALAKAVTTLWTIVPCLAGLACVAASLRYWPTPGAPLLPLGIGVLMLAHSSHFRQRFVECAFPIFYAIVQDEARSKAANS
jgi:hypothetical protein